MGRRVLCVLAAGSLAQATPVSLPSESTSSVVSQLLEDVDTISQSLESGSATSRKSLSELAQQFNTDKFTHNFVQDFYPKHLDSVRDQVKNVLEVGVHDGGSLKMWRDYFPNANVYGADIVDKSKFNGNRIRTVRTNQEDRTQLQKMLTQVQGGVDLFIDDGGHFMKQQLITLSETLPKLNQGGRYILEDLHTSGKDYHSDYGQKEHPTAMEVVQALKDKKSIASKHIPNMDAIMKRVQSVEIYADPSKPTESITSVITLN